MPGGRLSKYIEIYKAKKNLTTISLLNYFYIYFDNNYART